MIATGKDKGKKGKVLLVFPGMGKILVEGVNEQKKHQKPRAAGQKGQVVTKIAPIDVSNARYFCVKCNKGVRLGAKMVGTKKVRVCKSCSVELS